MRWLRWTAFVLFLAAVFGYEAYALFWQESGTSSNIPPARDLHLTSEVRGPEVYLQQSFTLHADGFTAIEVYPRQSQYPPTGQMRIIVYSVGADAWTPLASALHDMAAMDLSKPLRLEIPRMDNSAGRVFVVELYVPHALPGHGLRFEAGGPTYDYGNLVLSGAPQWGDLKFRTEVQRTTIFHNVQRMRLTLPAPLQSGAVLVTALLVLNLALAVVVYSVAFAPDRTENRTDDQSVNGSVATTADQPRV